MQKRPGRREVALAVSSVDGEQSDSGGLNSVPDPSRSRMRPPELGQEAGTAAGLAVWINASQAWSAWPVNWTALTSRGSPFGSDSTVPGS